MPKFSDVNASVKTFFLKGFSFSAICALSAASVTLLPTQGRAQQPTRGAFTMPFSHDPNAPALPAPDTNLPYPDQPANAQDGNSVNTAGLPTNKRPDKAQQEAQAIIASDRGDEAQDHDEEDQVWNDPNSNSTPPGDNPDNTLFNFP
ncbi:hypothetical protein FAI40_03740 [Acetobacteraceae bacterium]|nr:hypothetical protein FAI40_03740 [Acetobacteraceae bacterium]